MFPDRIALFFFIIFIPSCVRGQVVIRAQARRILLGESHGMSDSFQPSTLSSSPRFMRIQLRPKVPFFTSPHAKNHQLRMTGRQQVVLRSEFSEFHFPPLVRGLFQKRIPSVRQYRHKRLMNKWLRPYPAEHPVCRHTGTTCIPSCTIPH